MFQGLRYGAVLRPDECSPPSARCCSKGDEGRARGRGPRTRAPCPGRRIPALRLVCTHPVVLLDCASFCLTACKFAGLLTTCCGQRDAFGCPTRRARHHEHARCRQATETVTEVALGTGQRRHQRRVTPRAHPAGPLCIGRHPRPHRLLEVGETHGSPHGSPPSRLGLHVSAGEHDAWSSPACGEAWSRRRPAWRRPPCTARTAVGTARRGRALAWSIHGADGPPGRAGSGPCASSRLRTVALPPHGTAACSRGSQSGSAGSGGGAPATVHTRHGAPARFAQSRYASPRDAAWPPGSGRDRPWRGPAHRQRLLRGRSAVRPHGLPRHPPRRGPPAVPVALPQGLRGRWKRLAAHRRPPRAPQTFLERCCGRRRLPHRPQVLAQRAHPGARRGGARAPTARQGGALRFHRRARDEGVLPAPCACSRPPTVVRLDALRWPSGPLALVTRLLQRACSGRPWRLLRPRDTLERAARRLAPRGLEGLSPRSGHGLLTPQAADRHACRGAPVAPASPAPLPWPAPCGAARDDLERAAAAPAPPHATQHRRSPCGRATGGGCWQRPLGLPALVVLENHVPAAGARRRLQPHDTPRRQWRLPPCPVPGTSRFAHGLGRGAPRAAGSSRAGRGPPLGQTRSTGPWP